MPALLFTTRCSWNHGPACYRPIAQMLSNCKRTGCTPHRSPNAVGCNRIHDRKVRWADTFARTEMHLERLLRSIPLMIVITIGLGLHAQDSTRHHGIFYPAPLQDRNWHTGFGIVTFATPGSLTEEFRNRVPAIDVQLMRKVHGGL